MEVGDLPFLSGPPKIEYQPFLLQLDGLKQGTPCKQNWCWVNPKIYIGLLSDQAVWLAKRGRGEAKQKKSPNVNLS